MYKKCATKYRRCCFILDLGLPLWLDEGFDDVLGPAADGHNHRVVLRASEVAQVLEGFKNGLTSLETWHALELNQMKNFTNKLKHKSAFEYDGFKRITC